MRALSILPCLDIQAPAIEGDSLYGARCDDVVDPLLARLGEWSGCHAALHIGGPLLVWIAERRPETLERLRRLSADGQIELMGAGYYDPLLVAIPEHDATGQLRLARNEIRKWLALGPRGLWLRGLSWDPGLPTLLNRNGYKYTLVDEQSLAQASLTSAGLDGYYITERDGFSLAVFPVFTSTQARFGGRGDIEALRDLLAGWPARAVTFTFEDIRTAGDVAKIVRLMRLVRAHQDWLRLDTFSLFMDRQPPSGRIYPRMPCIDRDDHDTTQSLDWAEVLATYPEINFLHKRMLKASYRVHQLRTKAATLSKKGNDARQSIQDACTVLWQAQNHRAFRPGDSGKLYDAAVRGAAYSKMMAAERIARSMLDEVKEPFNRREVDFDCDGQSEILVDTGQIGAIISPHRGGGIFALELLERDLGLGAMVRRRFEPVHRQAAVTDIQLVEERTTEDAEPVFQPDQVARMWFDDRSRCLFRDHFLAPGTTLENWYRNQYREVGDFVDGSYEVIQQARPFREAVGRVQLGMNGTVSAGEKRSLVRIEKQYRFDLENPRLWASYRLINRYFEPAPAWFGIEANLVLPGGNPAATRFRADRPSGDVEGGFDSPHALHRVGYLELVDEAADLIICLFTETPMDIWMMPVETIVRPGDEPQRQGVALLLHGAHDLWGTEECRIDLRMEFLRT